VSKSRRSVLMNLIKENVEVGSPTYRPMHC
jgi:hypothetical protein